LNSVGADRDELHQLELLCGFRACQTNGDQETVIFLSTICRTFKQMMIEANIWGIFRETEFEWDVRVEPDHLLFDEATLSATLRKT
jgi:hypothetical protein